MTGKRFGVTPELPKGWVDIIDTNDKRTLCNIRIEYANNMIGLLNELYEENEQLKHSIKCLESDKMELQQYIKRMQGDVE